MDGITTREKAQSRIHRMRAEGRVKTSTIGNRFRDIAGFPSFSFGPAGQVHVMSHRILDAGHYKTGHQLLRAWLYGRSGAGSQWIHLQWHMAVFELAVGLRDAALTRFMEHLLPAVVSGEDALTDAPAFLWRLSLAASAPVELPWDAVCARALARMRRPAEPYVELHNLLALAGAGDVASLDKWLGDHEQDRHSPSKATVLWMGRGLRAFAARDYPQAVTMLAEGVPGVSVLGGSYAQNQLFDGIHLEARRRAGSSKSFPIWHRRAA